MYLNWDTVAGKRTLILFASAISMVMSLIAPMNPFTAVILGVGVSFLMIHAFAGAPDRFAQAWRAAWTTCAIAFIVYVLMGTLLSSGASTTEEIGELIVNWKTPAVVPFHITIVSLWAMFGSGVAYLIARISGNA